MSRANIRVRLATGDDIPQLVELLQSVDASAGIIGKPAQDMSVDHLTQRLHAVLETRERAVLVAVDEHSSVAGMLAACEDAIGAIDLTPVLHVTHLLVRPDHRRRGVGRALLTGAVQLADQAGTEHVLATAAAGSRESNRYLARIGFSPLVTHRIAPTSMLRRSLGMTDVASRRAVLRRARLARAQRSGFAARAVGRGA